MAMPRFQYSLRTLLIIVTLLAIPCGYIGWQRAIAMKRLELMREIEQLVDVLPCDDAHQIMTTGLTPKDTSS